MRFYTVLATRPQYYDRSPLQVSNTYFAPTQAPATLTTRWTYTVPSARKAFVEDILVEVFRDGVETTAAVALTQIVLTPNGGSANVLADARMINVAVDTLRQDNVAGAITLLAGDNLIARNQDAGATGTITYLASMVAIEFDA